MADTPPKLTYSVPSSFRNGEDGIITVRANRPGTAPGTQGTAFLKTDITSITHTLFRIYRGKTSIVSGHNGASVDKNTVWYDSLQGWERDSYGYNFRHVIDETDLDPVAVYKAIYDVLLTSGESFTMSATFQYLGDVDDGVVPGENPGNDGEDGADGQGIIWRGEWDSGTSYAFQDLVKLDNIVYIAKAVNSASQPQPDDSNTNWEVVIEGDGASSGSNQSALFVQTASVTVSNTTTETTVVSTSGALGALAVPTGTFLAGDQFKVTAWGVYSTKDTGAGTLTVELGLGSEIVATFDAVELNGAQADQHWDAWLQLTRRTEGTSGVVSGHGELTIGRTNMESVKVPISIAPTVLPSDADKTPTATGKWSVASSDNEFVCYCVRTDEAGGPA